MAEIKKHINDLLFLHDCVIVPGIGGFVANAKGAGFNEVTGVFSPPCREIGFNRSLTHNDGLLINHVAKREGISYTLAKIEIEQYASSLIDQIQNGAQVSVGEVGHLKSDSIGNIIFIPNVEQSFSSDAFGLSTFHFKSLQQIEEENSHSKHLIRRTINTKSVRQIAASITLIMGLLLVTPEFKNGTNNYSESSMIPEFHAISIPTHENYSLIKEEIPANSSDEIVTDEKVISHEAIELPNKFFIIVASFKEKAPAEKYLTSVKNEGALNAEIIKSNTGRYRISIAGYPNKEEAVSFMNDYRSKNKSAWLLTQK